MIHPAQILHARVLHSKKTGCTWRLPPRAGNDPAAPMELTELARLLPSAEVRGGSARITDVTSDSRAATPGTLFFCVPGGTRDGHDFASEAAARGASAVAVERWLDLDVAQMKVTSMRDAMGPVSAAVFDHPSRHMTVVGVTGTNGKTTTTFMLERAFFAAGMQPGLIGTVEIHVRGDVLPVVHTTPEAPELQRLLARMRDAALDSVAMEVSSHGLALRRVAGTRFACGVFTNLTRDHLDFHGTMSEYERAKATLFAGDLAERGAINIDDPTGERWVRTAAIPTVSFGRGEAADVRAVEVDVRAAGTSFICVAGDERVRVQVPITGRYNVSNALGVLATFRALGLPLEAAADGIAALPGVPGRLEAIDEGQPFTVLVDYAHTPDSLANVLAAARDVCAAELWVVFGCGGDRDRGKRREMGRVAVQLADRVVITSDNPRSEDPAAIVREIEVGAREASGTYEVELDRRAAIRRAVAGARGGDVVVIAGKGHETGQRFADRVIPFDDRTVAREELAALGVGR